MQAFQPFVLLHLFSIVVNSYLKNKLNLQEKNLFFKNRPILDWLVVFG